MAVPERCDCATAVCVIGNFYTCKTIDCANGPPRPVKIPVSICSGERGFITADRLGVLAAGDLVGLGDAPVLQITAAGRDRLSISAPGYQFAWGRAGHTDGRPMYDTWHDSVLTTPGDQTEHGCALCWRRAPAVADDF
jgi:hypothetical protein